MDTVRLAGTKLPFGAYIANWRKVEPNGPIYVMAHYRDAYIPWVVWRLDENGNPFSGDYFNSRAEAYERLKERARDV